MKITPFIFENKPGEVERVNFRSSTTYFIRYENMGLQACAMSADAAIPQHLITQGIVPRAAFLKM